MPLEIVRQDITKMAVDAIVNAANSTLLGGGGVDGAIHRAAGPRLLDACKTIGGCAVGDAKITNGYNLPARYVIHTVGPVWQGGFAGEEQQLRSCYRRCLEIARKREFGTVAFPLISSGAYGYPKDKALRVAVDEISRFILLNDMNVYIAVFDKTSFTISEKLFADIKEFIDDRYAESRKENRAEARADAVQKAPYYFESSYSRSDIDSIPMAGAGVFENTSASLSDRLSEIDESFSEMLLRKIDESGLTDSQCYKKANIDRKLFSKIRSSKDYRPKKTTVIAFAIALELSLSETEEMLKKAGFALSRSNKFDIIIEYFIVNGNYNIHEINEALFAFDQVLLGV